MTLKSVEKRKYIITKAKKVFIRKGFNSVTMQDIIAECGISRGGIYLYYNSVDEVFMDVIRSHNFAKLEQINTNISENLGFERMLDEYFGIQKERLLHLENSLLLAMHEFYLSRKDKLNRDFFFDQFHNTKKMIMRILQLGVEEHKIDSGNLDALSEIIMFTIEGISTLAMTGGVSGELLDSQFKYIKKLLNHNIHWEDNHENK